MPCVEPVDLANLLRKRANGGTAAIAATTFADDVPRFFQPADQPD
jgi:hypothetical protein